MRSNPRRKKIKKEYIETSPRLSKSALAKKYNLSISTVHKWDKDDKDTLGKSWGEIRDEYWDKIDKKKKEMQLALQTRNEVANIMDKNENTKKAVQSLNHLWSSLDSRIERMADTAKITDYLAVIKDIQKLLQGLGYADKVIVVGAPNPEKSFTDIIDADNADFEIIDED